MSQGERDLVDKERTKNDALLEVGEIYQARIEETGEGGSGIANLDGCIVFVPGAEPGMEVQIRITKVLGRIAFGKIVKQ
ncbi:MAG: TRAM domain-containing protein [Methanomassiliicoccales archaeon]|nr:MAG: TRAM domain-containing protein [Methanomassiliicoccales archaeon]